MIPTFLIKLILGRWITTAEGEIKDSWRWITATPVHLLAALLALSVGLNLYQWHLLAHDHKAIAAIKPATKLARKAQAAVNAAPAAKSLVIAKESDHDAQDYYAAGRAAGLAYADAHRVRPDRACPTGHTDLRAPDLPAKVDDGPSQAPGMVAVAQTDFDLLVANSTRLAQVHQVTDALIAAGVAVPAPEPSKTDP